MARPRTLPSDEQLARLYHLGYTDREIADEYKVKPQAVNALLVEKGLRRRPVHPRVNSLLAEVWDVQELHRRGWPVRALKVYLRCRLGDATVSAAEARKADQLVRRLTRENEVVDYSESSGWKYAKRQSSDGRWVLRWPAGKELPDAEMQWAMELPVAEVEDGTV